MNPERNKECAEFEPLLVKKIAGDLLPREEKSVENHLLQCAACAAEDRKVAMVWKKFDSLPAPEIPLDVSEKTRLTILGHLKQENSLFPWLAKIPMQGLWAAFLPVAAGLAMTVMSYGLIHRLVDPGVHGHSILVPLFSLWWLLFTGGVWLIFKGKGPRSFQFDLISASSISITLLTLLISFMVYELEPLRWLAMSAAYEIAVVTNYLFGVGNTFTAAWWVHCCLASFIGAFIFGFSRSSPSSENLLIGSFFTTILLSPAIYLQGSTHNHGLGLIAFASLGTYVGSFVGVSLGLFIRRRFSFQAG
ncbi:MAG: zf-HC2 domain-containing protein [Deltaproteobacteria bacterium]|nr:zf-HC2 domain-containing protein [Deltaproteobacteria bacterium]